MTSPALPPFQRLLDEHGPALWRYCRASLGPEDGADLFQETVLAALRAYPSLRHGENLRAWLFTIGHHRRLDMARTARRRPVAAGRHVEESDALLAVTDHDSVLDAEVWRSVGALPEKQRQAITYRYLADLPYAEVGEVIGCSEAAARQNVRAGLAALRVEVTP